MMDKIISQLKGKITGDISIRNIAYRPYCPNAAEGLIGDFAVIIYLIDAQA